MLPIPDPEGLPSQSVTASLPEPPLEALRGLYAATLQSGCWPRILEVLCPLVGTTKAIFFEVDRICPSDSVTEGVGLAPETIGAMRGRDLNEDYMWQAALRLPAGSVFRSGDLHPAQVLSRGPLYERIAVPAGIEHVLSANLENTSAFFSNICFLQGQHPFSDAARDTLALLMPHLQAAQQIARRIAGGDAGRREALLSFDRARQPMLTLDRSGYAIYCNEPARQLLDNMSACIALKFGRLVFADVAIQVDFERAVRLALAAPDSDKPVPAARIRVTRQEGLCCPFRIMVVPVQRAADRALLPEGSRCMLLINDTESRSSLPLDQFAWLYQLTAAEARICDALYRLGSVDAAANALSLTQHTVRSHLKSIYAKVGVSTQAQLMVRVGNSVRLNEGIERPEFIAGA